MNLQQKVSWPVSYYNMALTWQNGIWRLFIVDSLNKFIKMKHSHFVLFLFSVLCLPLSAQKNNQISTTALAFYDWGYINPPSTGWSDDQSVTYINTTKGGLLENMWNFSGDITKIPTDAFKNSPQTGTVRLPASIKEIGNYAFYGTKTTIVMPGNLETIGKYAFCSSEISSFSSSSLKSLGQYAFFGCRKLSEVSIEETSEISEITKACFGSCTNLNAVTLPSCIKTIREEAFENCTSLTSITIPSSVTYIGNEAFMGCDQLGDITVLSETPISITSNTFSRYGTLHVKKGCKSVYKAADYWKNFNIEEIGETASDEIEGTVSDEIEDESVSAKLHLLSASAMSNGLWLLTFKAIIDNNETISIEAQRIELRRVKSTSILGTWTFSDPSELLPFYQYSFNLDLYIYYGSSANWSDFDFSDNSSAFAVDFYYTYKGKEHKISSEVIPVIATDIKLDMSSVDLLVGETTTLTANISPRKTTNKNVIWSTSDATIATVDNGVVTAQKPGTAIIIATTIDGSNLKDSCLVKVTSEDNNTIALIDGQDNSSAFQFVGQQGRITYTRNFKNTNWQPLYVPFSMSYEDWASQGLEVARINGFYEYDDNKDGKIDRSALEVLKVTETEGDLIPNHPYMVRATTTGEKKITINNATLYPTEQNTIDCSTVETKYTFTGTYSAITNAELSAMGAYVLGGGALGQSTSNLNPMRWYMVRESRGGQLLPALKSIKVFVYGEDEADAIDFTYDNEAEGEAYNLMGQKVSSSQKGIVIRNGKKFVNK